MSPFRGSLNHWRADLFIQFIVLLPLWLMLHHLRCTKWHNPILYRLSEEHEPVLSVSLLLKLPGGVPMKLPLHWRSLSNYSPKQITVFNLIFIFGLFFTLLVLAKSEWASFEYEHLIPIQFSLLFFLFLIEFLLSLNIAGYRFKKLRNALFRSMLFSGLVFIAYYIFKR